MEEEQILRIGYQKLVRKVGRDEAILRTAEANRERREKLHAGSDLAAQDQENKDC
jgi:hypothetical protein